MSVYTVENLFPNPVNWSGMSGFTQVTEKKSLCLKESSELAWKGDDGEI